MSTDTADALTEALTLLDAAVAEINEQVGRLGDDTTPEAAVALLRSLREQRQRLGSVEAAVEARVAKTLGVGRHEAHGVQVRKGSSKTVWLDPRTLGWRIVAPLAVTPQGEVQADPQLVGDMLDRLFDCVAVAYFRTGTMRDFGVEYDDLVKREPGRRTVQILSPAESAG